MPKVQKMQYSGNYKIWVDGIPFKGDSSGHPKSGGQNFKKPVKAFHDILCSSLVLVQGDCCDAYVILLPTFF